MYMGAIFLGFLNGMITKSTKGQAVLIVLANMNEEKFQDPGLENLHLYFLKVGLSQPCDACGALYRELYLTSHL